jgi:hypothetical protein
MRKNLLKVAVALAIGIAPAVAHADSPSLASFNLFSTQFLATGGQTFDVQFLFGRQSLSSTLFYQTAGVDGSSWTRVMNTVGNFGTTGAATVVPAPGTVFPLSGSFTVGGVGSQTVVFALCTGNAATFAGCQAPGPFYTSTYSTPSTNVRALAGWQWNGIVNPAEGSTTTRSTVFGFEDNVLALSDSDFNDVVFATNLSVVPEPSTYALMAVGLISLGLVSRRRRNAA